MQLLKNIYLALCLMVLTVSHVFAETPADAEVIDEVQPPPKVMEGEPLDTPDITIRNKNGKKIEEYRVNGELYMIKVTPKGGKPYYLHKRDKDGSWSNVGPNEPTAVPQWVLFRF